MARLPRLVLAGQAHLVIQRGLAGQPVFADRQDGADYLRVLREAAGIEAVALHAWALMPFEVQLLVTPASAPALARLVQQVGRRYVAAHNRRHGRRGTVWAGRFGSAAIEPGPWRLTALQSVDSQVDALQTSAGHRLGGTADSALTDPPEYWALGNTPFEREAAYRAALQAGVPNDRAMVLRRAVLAGWPVGGAPFLEQASRGGRRPSSPRPRGRPLSRSAPPR